MNMTERAAQKRTATENKEEMKRDAAGGRPFMPPLVSEREGERRGREREHQGPPHRPHLRNEALKGGHTSGQGHSESCGQTEKPEHTPSPRGEPPRPTETPRALHLRDHAALGDRLWQRASGAPRRVTCLECGLSPRAQSSGLTPLHHPGCHYTGLRGFPLQAPPEACTQASPAWRPLTLEPGRHVAG